MCAAVYSCSAVALQALTRGGPAMPHLNICLLLTSFVFPSQTLELDMIWSLLYY